MRVCFINSSCLLLMVMVLDLRSLVDGTAADLGINTDPPLDQWTEEQADGTDGGGMICFNVNSPGTQTGDISITFNLTAYEGTPISDYFGDPSQATISLPVSTADPGRCITVYLTANNVINFEPRGFIVYLTYDGGDGENITKSLVVLIIDNDGCNGGQYYNNETSQCSNCSTGEWAPEGVPLQLSCTSCPDGTTTLGPNANSSSDCECMAGYYLDSDSCIPCQRGEWKLAGNVSFCNTCTGNQTTLSNGTSTQDDCGCNPGQYLGGGNVCYPCPADSYNTDFNGTCKICPQNTVSSEGSTSSSECECVAGYYFDGQNCTECPKAEWKMEGNATSCNSCPGNLTTKTKASGSVEECACDVGQYLQSSNSCTACQEGTFNENFNGTCENCPTNMLSNLGSVSSTQCECVAGYYLDGQSCTECEKGEWIMQGNATSCNSCPGNQTTMSKATQSILQCGCDIGQYYGDDQSCYPCPEGTNNDVFNGTCQQCPTNMLYANDSVLCECLPGYYLNGSECSECPVATWKAESGNLTRCLSCPDNQTTLLSATTDQDSCGCVIGHYKHSDDNCYPCPENTYNNKFNGTCESCGSNSLSESGSSSSSECVCAAGTEGNGTDCHICLRWTYQPGGVTDSVSCTPCAIGNIAPYSASSASQCYTPENTYAVTGNIRILNINCSTELADKSSPQHESLALELNQQIGTIFTQKYTSFLTLSNFTFTCGSVIAVYETFFNGSSGIDVTVLKQDILDSLDSSGFLNSKYQLELNSVVFREFPNETHIDDNKNLKNETESSDGGEFYPYVLVPSLVVITICVSGIVATAYFCPKVLRRTENPVRRRYRTVRVGYGHVYPRSFANSRNSRPYRNNSTYGQIYNSRIDHIRRPKYFYPY